MPPALANSAYHPDYSKLIETVTTAHENGFTSVQLYVNKVLVNPEYRQKLVQEIIDSGITSIVIHLPNYLDQNDAILSATQELVKLIPEGIKLVGLMHYEDREFPIDFPNMASGKGIASHPFLSLMIPRFKGLIVGLENSKISEFDTKHVMRAFNMARMNNIPFVFDIGRIMYPKPGEEINEDTKQEAYAFIEWLISQLDPAIDVIHTSGKTEWGKFRDFACALGAEGDITIPLMPALKDFSDRGGIVVFEHEDLAQAIESKRNFEH